jgi:hypothetical protein
MLISNGIEYKDDALFFWCFVFNSIFMHAQLRLVPYGDEQALIPNQWQQEPPRVHGSSAPGNEKVP